jgi:rod shape-determining protein MreC
LAENKKLSSQLVLASETKGESAQLNGVLDLAGRGGYKVVAARVIGHGSASSFSQTITINQGSRSGIKNDMTVISQNGLVGLVKNVTSTSAIVLLMSDPSFKVGVKITRSQSIGILQGQGNGSYSLVLLDPAGTIKVGDNLVTNGSDNNHPFIPGVPVGQVTVLDNSTAALAQSATVESYANLNDLGVVSVVLAAPTVAPSVPLRPTPNPTVTVLVTPTPTPSTSTTPTVSPSPTTSIKKK